MKPKEPAGYDSAESSPAPVMENRTILVVDDDPDDREVIRRRLRHPQRTYAILEAATGAEGLELIRSAAPDCILLDYYLPDMDGIRFLEVLRHGVGGGTGIPVAMLSGQESDDIAAAALRSGAQDYLVKEALTGPALMRAIENAIQKFTIQRELEESRLAVELRNRKLEVLRAQLQEKLDELAEATRTRDQFMAVMSHEMRTPLNAIIGYADLLDMELDGPLTPGQRAQVGRIQVGSRHLLDLINDVLDLARAEAAKLDLDLRPVDLGAVLEEVAGLLERQAEEKGIRLVVDAFAHPLPPVHADLQRLRQILTNLIGNAIKFTEEGSVRVHCEIGPDGGIRTQVVDTGIGIDPEVLPLVFSEFYQARGELTREKGGTGLGLAISLRLAHLMGGDIVARSTPGEGSTFTLILQPAGRGSEFRTEDVAGHAARMQLQGEAQALQPPEGVSVVAFGDQRETLAELAQQVRPGVRLCWTTDVDQVARLAVEENAALVVLDIGCRDGAAWRAAQALQDVPELGDTAILLLPSIPPIRVEEAKAAGLDLGWLSLVAKPFTAAQLTQAVSAAAEGHEAREEGLTGVPARLREVLVVDDDPDSRRVAAKFLAQASLRVREAGDGESALVEMHRNPPDVVVLDLMMPVLDGFGVLATMRADASLAGIPVVVLTAKSLTEAERQFLARTAVRVLQKGEHRLTDVASLVLRAAARTHRPVDATAGGEAASSYPSLTATSADEPGGNDRREVSEDPEGTIES
jgi:signal transduction histidine kinase